jgi:hypothetical protein
MEVAKTNEWLDSYFKGCRFKTFETKEIFSQEDVNGYTIERAIKVWANNNVIRECIIQYNLLSRASKNHKYVIINVPKPNGTVMQVAGLSTFSNEGFFSWIGQGAERTALNYWYKEKKEIFVDKASTFNHIDEVNNNLRTELIKIRSPDSVTLADIKRLESDIALAIEGICNVALAYKTEENAIIQPLWVRKIEQTGEVLTQVRSVISRITGTIMKG